jgi:hypothetical protein
VGSEATVKEGLERLVAVSGANELIVVTDTWDHGARLESYRRLAEIAKKIEMKTTAGLLGTAR